VGQRKIIAGYGIDVNRSRTMLLTEGTRRKGSSCKTDVPLECNLKIWNANYETRLRHDEYGMSEEALFQSSSPMSNMDALGMITCCAEGKPKTIVR
jgi:hypothetical protein